MMIDCFLAAGLTDFRIDIGQAEFYKGIMDALEASEEVKEQIHEYIENKNALGMEILLSDLSMKDCEEIDYRISDSDKMEITSTQYDMIIYSSRDTQIYE